MEDNFVYEWFRSISKVCEPFDLHRTCTQVPEIIRWLSGQTMGWDVVILLPHLLSSAAVG